MNTNTYYEVVTGAPNSNDHRALTYLAGFTASLALTVGAYCLVMYGIFPMPYLFIVIFLLAFVQFSVQMTSFLHLSAEASGRDRLLVFLFALFVVAILVVGSLWIMLSLSERMMPSQAQMERYMKKQTGI